MDPRKGACFPDKGHGGVKWEELDGKELLNQSPLPGPHPL